MTSRRPSPRIDSWNACAVPWKRVADRRGQHLGGRATRCRCTAVAERAPGREVEGDVHRGELTRVVDGERTDGAAEPRERVERHELARRAERT